MTTKFWQTQTPVGSHAKAVALTVEQANEIASLKAENDRLRKTLHNIDGEALAIAFRTKEPETCGRAQEISQIARRALTPEAE